MMNSLTQKPSAHTVMEWVFAALVPSLYQVAQKTGLLEECAKGNSQIDSLAARLSLSERGVSAVVRCLFAAGILVKDDRGSTSVVHDKIEYYITQFNALEALVRSLQQGIFDAVKEDGILPEDAPRELSCLGITEVVGEYQILTAAGRRYFTPGQDHFVGNYVSYAWKLVEVLSSCLLEAVKTGQPVPALKADNNQGFFAPLVSALFSMHFESAQQLADHLTAQGKIQTLLDIGSGSGVWSIPLAERNPQLHVDALDFPLVLNVTKTFTQKYGVQSQYTFRAGNTQALEQEEYGTYDVIYTNYLVDGLSPDEIQHLFTLCERHLRPDGYLVVASFSEQPDWTGPLRDTLFSLIMLCLTDYGDTYLASTYENWCRNAGLEQLQWVSVPASLSPILLARKNGNGNGNGNGTRTTSSTLTGLGEQKSSHTSHSSSAQSATDAAFVPPTSIVETNFAFAQSCMLLAAVELRLFTHIAHGAHNARQLAERAEVSQQPLERLLGGLCAMNFLARQGDEYTLTPLSERYLVADRETYIGDVTLQIRREWDAWINLTNVVQSGVAVRYVNEEPLGGSFFAPLAQHSFPLVYSLMRHVFTRLEVGTEMYGTRLLDLGAGTAPASIAALELDADAQATLIDFPEVLEYAKKQAQEHGVEDRIDYYPGDLATIQLPAAQFDIAVASHVFRILGPEITQQLIKQCYQALKPGGCLVVVETYKEPEQSEKLFPHIISVNMLVNTRHGDALASKQVYQWLLNAGFQVKVWENKGTDPLLIATHPWS